MTNTLQTRADERLALDLMAAIRTDAEVNCAPNTVELVSVTIDVTGNPVAGNISFEPRIDRRTRTVLFSAGNAVSDGAPVMAATAVYRIISAE